MPKNPSDKEMSQAFIERYEIAIAPAVRKIKDWDGDPSKSKTRWAA